MDLYDQAQKNNDQPQTSDVPDLSSLMSAPTDNEHSQTNQTPVPQIEPISVSALDVPVTHIDPEPTIQEKPLEIPNEVLDSPITNIPNSTPNNTLQNTDQTFMHMSDIPKDSSNTPITEPSNSAIPPNNPPSSPPPEPPVAPPSKPKFSAGRGILFAVIALTLLTLPVIGFFATRPDSQADTRSEASSLGFCEDPNDPSTCISPSDIIASNTPEAPSTSIPPTAPETTNPPSQNQSPVAGSCAPLYSPCETNRCCDGLVCQGHSGNRVCQQPESLPDQQCGGQAGSCGKLIAFHCNTNFESEAQNSGCLENPKYIPDNDAKGWQEAREWVAGCGQIDVVCKSGDNENKLCGDFEIIKTNCGPGSQPTPVPISQCKNLKIYRDGVVVKTDEYNTLRPQQQIQFAVVAKQEAGKARFFINNQDVIQSDEKNAQGEYFINWTIPEVGQQRTFNVQAEVRINGVWQ